MTTTAPTAVHELTHRLETLTGATYLGHQTTTQLRLGVEGLQAIIDTIEHLRSRVAHTDEARNHYSHAATELELYLLNDAAVYRAYYLPACQNLARRRARGEFDRDRGLRAMRHVTDAGAKQYTLEHGSMVDRWHDIFPKGDRDRVAETLLDRFLDAVRADTPFW